jgi:hypothetical protein
MDSEVMLLWIERILNPYLQTSSDSMLMLDDFSAHHVQPVKEALNSLGTAVENIPPGYTGALQVLDVGVNKPFKDSFNKLENDYMLQHRAQEKIKITRKLVASWIDSAWTQISDVVITNSFRKVLGDL